MKDCALEGKTSSIDELDALLERFGIEVCE